mmetsp:Transcript_15332/g.31090  ORF Transcript_15332/g.31090 Transcript_15332/m.31090 type:complete len:276 (+) Transcript_15332:1927-2754(+)
MELLDNVSEIVPCVSSVGVHLNALSPQSLCLLEPPREELQSRQVVQQTRVVGVHSQTLCIEVLCSPAVPQPVLCQQCELVESVCVGGVQPGALYVEETDLSQSHRLVVPVYCQRVQREGELVPGVCKVGVCLDGGAEENLGLPEFSSLSGHLPEEVVDTCVTFTHEEGHPEESGSPSAKNGVVVTQKERSEHHLSVDVIGFKLQCIHQQVPGSLGIPINFEDKFRQGDHHLRVRGPPHKEVKQNPPPSRVVPPDLPEKSGKLYGYANVMGVQSDC